MVKLLKQNAILDFKSKEFLSSFEMLKKLITSEPVLQPPDFSKKFVLTTDASQYAIGSVLSQNGHPISFASRTLSDHEIRYSTIEKEALAVVWSIKHFRTYLYGRKFQIQTDHKPLVWLHNIKEPNMKLQRWKIMLNEYDFDIVHIKGKDNTVADFLSRYVSEDGNNFENANVFNNQLNTYNNECNEEQMEISSTGATIHSALEDSLNYIKITEKPINYYKNQIYLSYGQKEDFRIKIVNNKHQSFVEATDKTCLRNIMQNILIEKGIMCIFCDDDELFLKFQNVYTNFFHSRNLIIYRSNVNLIQVTDKNDILTIIEKEHIQNNHRGIQEVYSELKNKYFYPKLYKLITIFINNCSICNIAKHDRNPIKIPYQISESPSHFNDIVHIDIWFPCRNTFYLTTIDKFSKYATFHKLNDRNWISILAALKE